jgi:hypothetical protein
MFATIGKPSTPRGGGQGDNSLYLSSKLKQEVGRDFVIEEHDKISFRQATIFDNNIRNANGSTSFKSSLDLKPGRHKVIKQGDKFIML